ncbi:MAG: phenylalanine--tRNA ligase subunit beta [Planctomycetota bacterium]|nr:phenylalanine--tRNA ligase subunit beta [Planctomycetota bacterium]
MIVTWNWLKDYVDLDMPVDKLTHELTMSGLNLEGTEDVDGDIGIDLEVTSNRPDCLGHIGVAREISVLFNTPLKSHDPKPTVASVTAASATSVEIECDDLCPQYIARVVRGVKIGPSPQWLIDRLRAASRRRNDDGTVIEYRPINNVVDITNYVLLESGQPLHAFDFDKLNGGRIVVRRAKDGEKIAAIDQKEYSLDSEMCVIADAERPVAIGGVMGGLETEISDDTVNVLVETAAFAPLSIRTTARKLKLFSDSSYRFERGTDRRNLDWVSRRCCELILELAGGELLEGSVMAGSLPPDSREPITLRYAQVPRVLGIDVSKEESDKILNSLGLKKLGGDDTAGSFEPPSWRRDLEREADLIEEVARIHGYEKIPTNHHVPMVSSSKTRRDRVIDRLRDALTGAGFFETLTLSFVTEKVARRFTPRGDRPLLRVEHSTRKAENVLRPSVVPSLLECRRANERQSNFNANLFEIAKVYLESDPSRPEIEVEPTMIGVVTGKSFAELKGLVELLTRTINASFRVTARPSDVPQFAPGRGAELLLNGKPWGWMGELDRSVSDSVGLRDAVHVAEFSLHPLERKADLTPHYRELSQFPEMTRDVNFVLDESVAWEQLEGVVRGSGGPLLESVSFMDQYRGQQIPAGKKSYVFTVRYRSSERTLTSEEIDSAQAGVIAACESQFGCIQR